jgi:glycosyltransferase involved in cell wall biosynthesis
MGVQYQAGSAVSLADALDRLASDPDSRRRMAQHSYRAASDFDLQTQYAKYADLIEQVSANHVADEARFPR